MSASQIEQKVIPPLKSNPFSAKPLESQQRSLFVGRKDIILELSRLIRSKSPRTILLVGERGSGRTSLIQCLAPHSPKHYNFTLFPEIQPSKSVLEELYASIIDFDVPLLPNKIVEGLVSSINESSIQLPLISFDYGGTPGANTKEVFQRLSPVFRRLTALTIVALTPTQLSAWPEELINEFDKKITLDTLTTKEISELVKCRIKPEIRGDWNPPKKLIGLVEDRTGGKVQDVVRLMRDLVESLRGGGLPGEEVLMLLNNLDIEEINNEGDEDEIEGNYSTELVIENDNQYESGNEFSDSIEPSYELENYDDELAYNKEQDYAEDVNKTSEEDLPNLNEEKITDNSNYIENYPRGAFGRLAMRNKEALKVVPRIDSKKFKTSIKPEPPTLESAQIQTHEASLWVSDEIKDSELEDFKSLNLSKHNNSENDTNNKENLLSKLQSLNSNSEQKSVSEFPLEPNHLRNLDHRELILVDLATRREFSPSDEELQQKLEVGRSRISQLCTPLLKSGILVARLSGRSRYYTISSSAKSQLIAWGIING